jgi:hypothetical protein
VLHALSIASFLCLVTPVIFGEEKKYGYYKIFSVSMLLTLLEISLHFVPERFQFIKTNRISVSHSRHTDTPHGLNYFLFSCALFLTFLDPERTVVWDGTKEWEEGNMKAKEG